MKLVPTLVSLLTTALLLPFALSTPVSRNGGEAPLVRKTSPNLARGSLGAEYVPTTNAERFARGLPPLSPSKSRNHGSPTRRNAVSPVPLVTIRGYVQVYKSGTAVGWIGAKGGNDYNWYSSSVDKLIVSFSLPVGQNSGSGLNLLTENSQKPSASVDPYFGFATWGAAGMASGDSWDEAFLTPTSKTTSTASIGTSGSSYTYVQSNVWSINIDTGAMSATWTNSDGSVPSVTLFDYGSLPLLGGSSWAAYYDKITLKFVRIV